jgi:tetratricopeptide (TPR) repeat protein
MAEQPNEIPEKETPDSLNDAGIRIASSDPQAALALFERALAARPDDSETLFNRGAVLHRLGRLDEALSDYERALTLNPANVPALSNRGAVLLLQGRFEDAIANYDRALTISDRTALHYNRGLACLSLGRNADALAAFDRALARDSNHVGALHQRGVALVKLNRHPDALTAFDRALSLQPANAALCHDRACTLLHLNRANDALAAFDDALAVQPNFAEARTNRAAALLHLQRANDAFASFAKALKDDPRHAPAYYARARALHELNRLPDAIADYERFLALRPDDAAARFDLSVAQLCLGDYAAGWQNYESRWTMPSGKPHQRGFSQPLWSGQVDLRGQTLLLHAEQGLGDTIQCLRFIPLLHELGAKIVLEIPAPLRPLARAFSEVSAVVAYGEALPSFDCHCPLLSLPLALDIRVATIPARTPYLAADPARIAHWAETLKDIERPRVGLVWAGSGTNTRDRTRSVPLAMLGPMLAQSAFSFVSMQKDLRKGDRDALEATGIHHIGDQLTDFADTAAALSAMDLVISVDTAVAHLGGALGKPTWILLPFAPDWRWMLERTDSPWYPTARLFRQRRRGDWNTVLADIASALAGFPS